MIQYEELIMKESVNICKQLSSEIKGLSTIKPLKRVTDGIKIILLFVTALAINLLIHLRF